MDVVQKQVTELSKKVDTLHALLEQLTEQVGGIALTQQTALNQNASNQTTLRSATIGSSMNASVGASAGGDMGLDTRLTNLSPVAMKRVADPSMTHKDVLSDEPHIEGDKSSASTNLSPEVQIQRLTAQLTAAYNRMAALEEQIIACRFQ